MKVLRPRQRTEQHYGLKSSVEDGAGDCDEDDDTNANSAQRGFRSNDRKLMQPCQTTLCEAGVEAFGERRYGVTAEARKGARLSDQMQNRRSDALAAFNLLELELVAPGNEGTPDKLVGSDDDQDHYRQTPGDGDAIASVGGGLKVGAEAGKAEVTRTEVEHLARHKEEPCAGDGHDGVPDETDGGVGQLQLEKPLDAREAIDSGRFHQFLRDALE